MSQLNTPFQRHRLIFLLTLILVFLVSPQAAISAELPPAVVSALKEVGIPLSSVAIVVQGVDAGHPIIRHNARQAMSPASTMKLLTTYAALELLGPAYTWRTEALSEALALNGQLDGNLYLRGSGDPRLTLGQFWLLLRQLRARGVRDIGGDLVLDRSAFALPVHNPADFDNEPLRPYNAGPDALLVNLKTLQLTLVPDKERNFITVIPETPGDDQGIDSRMQLSDDACGDWRERIKVKVAGESGDIQLAGSFSANCGARALYLSPWPADVYLDRLFRALWRELGGTLHGNVREGVAPLNARHLAVQESYTLGEVVRDINKYSNNVMVRQVFLTLAAERPATPDGARRRIKDWLDEKKLRFSGLVLDNGSGLSRSERISADDMSQLLLAAWKSPVMPELMSSLPLAGVDGTLKERLGESAANAHAHLKTGYLEGVRAISGYVLDRSGKRWVVVFLINDAQSNEGKPAIDMLVRWVAEH